MTKSSESTLAQEQMKIKPQIEEMIPELLGGELKESALEFVALLKEDKLKPRYASYNSWKVSYKGECICYIKIEKGIWYVAFRLEKFEREFSDGFQKAIQNNLKPCEACLKACAKGVNLIVFGKESTNICRGWPIRFGNPNDNTVGYIKELIEYRKHLISTNTLPPPFWWN